MAEYSGCTDMRDLLTLYLHVSRNTRITEDLRQNIIKMGENITNMMRECACDCHVTVEQLKEHVAICPQCQNWMAKLMNS